MTGMSKAGSFSNRKKVAVTGFTVFLLFVLAFVIFLARNFHTIKVKGDSMEPTFKSGDTVLVSRAYWLVGQIKKNDIVVVQPQPGGEFLIKRVYATGGETIDLYNAPDNWSLAQGEPVVPPGEFYVLGDNRPVSEDSRIWGPVRLEQIMGKVIIIRFGLPSARAATE